MVEVTITISLDSKNLGEGYLVGAMIHSKIAGMGGDNMLHEARLAERCLDPAVEAISKILEGEGQLITEESGANWSEEEIQQHMAQAEFSARAALAMMRQKGENS